MKKEALYKQIIAQVKAGIAAGDFLPGQKLPTEAELSKTFHTSRNTVIKALDALSREGLIYRMQGKGSYVSPGRQQSQRLRSDIVSLILPFGSGDASRIDEFNIRELPRVRRLWDTPIAEKDHTLALHQRDAHFLTWKEVCRRHLRRYFGREFEFEPWQDFALGVNILCGNVFKTAIEYSRSRKWEKTGVLWWSLLDMWPMMFNYSVVDNNFRKKMPYYWIRQSQQPLCLMVEEDAQGVPELYAANDTLHRRQGEYKITAHHGNDREEAVASGRFDVPPNQSLKLHALAAMTEQALLLIEWQADGRTCYNHSICGEPPFAFEQWRAWCARLSGLYKKDNES